MRTNIGPRRAVSLLVATLALALALLWAWHAYHGTRRLHAGFGQHMRFGALPLYADPRRADLLADPDVVARVIVAGLVALAGIGLVAVAAARRWRTPLCLAIAVVAVAAVNVAVARVPRGGPSLTAPFARVDLEYFGDIGAVERLGPRRFVANYPALTGDLSHHSGTHPPGGATFLWLGSRLLGTSIEAAAAWAIAFTALAVVPAFALARTLGGAAAARRLLPLYVAAPNLILYGATCMDGVFLTFALTALASGFAALRRGSLAWAIVAGAALWLATFMTFAVVAVPVMFGCYAAWTTLARPRRGLAMFGVTVAIGAAFIACQGVAWLTVSYDLPAVARAAMAVDRAGLTAKAYASLPIYASVTLGNALAFAIGSGVAAAALFAVALGVAARHPRRATTTLAAAVATCVAILSACTLFTLETERVWLFLTPVLLIAATPALRGVALWAIVPALLAAQAIAIEVRCNTWW